MATFYIPQLKSVLHILEDCYGFDSVEILSELAESLKPYFDDKRMDEILCAKRATGKNRSVMLDLAINLDGNVEICTTDDFSIQLDSISNLCKQYITDESAHDSAIFIISFMSAIFNRETNEKTTDDIVKRYRRSWSTIHPDLLRLYIALNKAKPKRDTSIKISFRSDSPHLIDNKDWWLSDMLNDFVKQVLGNISVDKAEHELKRLYSDDKGRKSSNPYLNYIIHGTYNFIASFLKSDKEKVTVEQCRFLLEYLKITGQIKAGDTLDNINTLQSTVKSLIKSKLTPVDKHIKRTKIG